MLFGFFVGVASITLFSDLSFWVKLLPLGLSFLFLVISNKKKREFVMGEVGVDMVKSFYNEKIRNKFNM